jgi:hypothetical protein
MGLVQLSTKVAPIGDLSRYAAIVFSPIPNLYRREPCHQKHVSNGSMCPSKVACHNLLLNGPPPQGLVVAIVASNLQVIPDISQQGTPCASYPSTRRRSPCPLY